MLAKKYLLFEVGFYNTLIASVNFLLVVAKQASPLYDKPHTCRDIQYGIFHGNN